MPSLRDLRAKLKIRDGERGGPLENLSLYAYVDRVCQTRKVLRDAKLRPRFEATYGIQPDWDKIEAEDRIRSASLRQLLAPCVKLMQPPPPPDLRHFGHSFKQRSGKGLETREFLT